jgi:hypothetical protein
VDHTIHCEHVAKGPRRAKRHVCQNCLDDVYRKQNQHKHHLCMKQEEDQSPYFDYIVFATSDSLDDQTAHDKFCSSHYYEKQKMMTQSCQTCTTW